MLTVAELKLKAGELKISKSDAFDKFVKDSGKAFSKFLKKDLEALIDALSSSTTTLGAPPAAPKVAKAKSPKAKAKVAKAKSPKEKAPSVAELKERANALKAKHSAAFDEFVKKSGKAYSKFLKKDFETLIEKLSSSLQRVSPRKDQNPDPALNLAPVRNPAGDLAPGLAHARRHARPLKSHLVSKISKGVVRSSSKESIARWIDLCAISRSVLV